MSGKRAPEEPGGAANLPAKRPKQGEGLSDELLSKLSGTITSETELRTLVIEGLKVEYPKIPQAIINNRGDFISAVFKILYDWMLSKTDRHEAYTDLHGALKRCKMNHRAGQLQDWAAAVSDTPDITPQRIEELQRLTRESIRSKPFCLAMTKDWTLRPGGRPDVRDIHTSLSWTRKHRGECRVESKKLGDLVELLGDEELSRRGAVRILVQAPGGMGKSTTLKHVAVTWADGTDDKLNRFHFIFHLGLKHVKDDSAIEDIIIVQHCGLKANRVQPAEIRSILDGDYKVLLLLDGHDEYKQGRNKDIDEAITKQSLWNCWAILTSRETAQVKDVKEFMDAEVEIHGFDEENIRKYIKKSLNKDKDKTDKLLDQARKSGLITFWDNCGILAIPILLNMICVLFKCNTALPGTKCGIMQAIVDRCMNREAIRDKGQKAVDSAKQALVNLGKLAWQGLKEPGKRLMFEKEEVLRIAGAEALELGLLFGTEGMTPQEEESDLLCFAHLMLQEFVGAIYIAEQDKASLELLFPTYQSILDQEEVVRFACCLSTQPQVLLEIICDRLAHHAPSQYLKGYDLLPAISQDLSGSPSFDPLHNKYVNYVDIKDLTDMMELTQEKYKMSEVCVLGIEKEDMSHESYRPMAVVYPEHHPEHASASHPVKYIKMHSKKFRDPIIEAFTKLLPQLRTYGRVLVQSFDARIYLSPEITLQASSKQTDLPLSGAYTVRDSSCMQLLGELQKYQPVILESLRLENLDIAPDSDEERLLLESVQLSENVKRFRLERCSFSAPVWKHLTEQVQGCVTLKTLELDTVINVPVEFLQVITKGWSASEYSTTMAQGMFPLIKLSLSNTVVTGAVRDPLTDVNKDLQSLTLAGMKLSEEDIQALGQILPKLCNLQELVLSENVLTDCMSCLLQGMHSVLQVLCLDDMQLSQDDISCLAEALHWGQFPRLYKLDLHMRERGSLTRLFGNTDQHTRFSTLILLGVHGAVGGEDVTGLAESVQSGKLPELQRLVLPLIKRADGLGEEVKNLVRTCVTQYGHRERGLYLGLPCADSDLQETIRAMCKGSNIGIFCIPNMVFSPYHAG